MCGREVSPRRDGRRPHPVAVDAFCLGRALVTRANFVRFVAATGHVTDAERRGYGVESVEGNARLGVAARVSFRAKRKRNELSGPPKPSMQANKPRRGG